MYTFFTFTRISWLFGGATSTSSIENALPGSQMTAALHLITCVDTDHQKKSEE